MSQDSVQTSAKEFVVRVPKNAKKKYHVMRFHMANQVDFKQWSNAKMERENNYKEYKGLHEDEPKFGAGSVYGKDLRDEARRKRYGINRKRYQADNQPWLLSVKDKTLAQLEEKKFKGIREGGVSDNSSWYVFMQAKDGAFEAYPIEEWYKFQPIQRYKALNDEEAEAAFEKRDKVLNLFSVMYNKRLKKDAEDDLEEAGASSSKKKAEKNLKLSELDDWMSDGDSDEDDDKGSDDPDKPKKKKAANKKPSAKSGKKKGKKFGKMKKTEDGQSGSDCMEESDEFDDGAEHEYDSEDSSDPEEEVREGEIKGVEEADALKDSDDDSDTEEEKKKKEEAEKKEKKESPADSESSDDDTKPKIKKEEGGEKAVDSIKRKIMDNPDSLGPPAKKVCKAPITNLPQGDMAMFEEQIRRYLLRKPMTTTELLHKVKSKKTGYSSEKLVEIIASMLKKINPHKRKSKGTMYLSLKNVGT